MRFSVRTARRAAVALAVGCTTALTATAASAAPTSPAHSARPGVIHACVRSDVKFGVSQGSGAAGTFTYLLRFTNTSRHTCTLFGFPGVTAVNRHDRQLGSPAARVSGAPLRAVVLRRGWTGHAVLRITDAGFIPRRLCRPAAARGLHVILPSRVFPGHVRLRFLACSRPGTIYMRVQRVQPGRGHL
jgi:hypothetical protein